jgi:hypothetical protein
VRSFNETIRSMVVSTDLNMVDFVTFREVIESFDEGSAVVSDDFVKRTPSAEKVFEDPIS